MLDTSINMVPTAAALAGADAYIGLCSPAVLTNASPRPLWVHNYTAGMGGVRRADTGTDPGRIFTNSKRLAARPSPSTPSPYVVVAGHRLARPTSGPRWKAAGTGPGRGRNSASCGQNLIGGWPGGIGTEIAWRANSLGMR